MNPFNVLQLLNVADQAAHRREGLGWLGATTAGLPAGSIARVGFEISPFLGYNAEAFQQDAEVCVYGNGGDFNTVDAHIDQNWGRDYLTVRVTTAFDFAKIEDLGGFIHQRLNQCGWSDVITRRDAVIFEYGPAGQSTGLDPSAGASNAGNNSGGAGQNNQNITPSRCAAGQYDSTFCGCGKAFSVFPPGCYPADANGNTSVGNKLATELGVTPTTAAIVGVLGALVLVIAINKAVK